MVEPLGFGRNHRPWGLPAISRYFSPRSGRQTGAATAEVPVVLLVLFLFLAFPMLNLATSVLRAYFLRSAVLEAAHKAAKACTFIKNVDASAEEPFCESAVNRANDTLDRFAAGFKGISIDSRQTAIIRQNAQSGDVTEFTNKLAASDIDSEKFLYYVEVRITGKADPLLSMNGTIVPSVEGLTGPMNLKLAGRELFEQFEGLAE